MLMPHDKIIGLNVVTESGDNLGTVASFDIDVDVEDQNVIYYHVKNSGLITGLFKQELMVHRSQVVSIEANRLIVADNVSQEAANEKTEKVSRQLEEEIPTLSVKE